MKRLLILAPALLLALPAMAQDAPAAGYQNLWCHFAFSITMASIPPIPAADLEAARTAGDAATPEQIQLIEVDGQIQHIANGIPTLLETATAGYTEAGFTTEQFDTAKAELDAKVNEQLIGSATAAEFTFEECLALVAPAETPAQ